MSSDPKVQLQQLSQHRELEILIRAGTQHWAAGEISLVVRGDGGVAVEQKRADATASFHGQLTAPETDELGQLLARHDFTKPRTSELPREPGDTPVLLSLRRGGKVVFAAELWEADRDSDPDLEAILRAAEQLLHRVSGGALGR